jgi:hypothetical protein
VSKRGVGLVVLLVALLGTAVLAQAEVVQKGSLRVSFEGKLTPTALPRSGEAPVRVAVSAKVEGVGGKAPPAMRTMTIEINRYGHLNRAGLPTCKLDQIQPATTVDALAICRRALVGEGQFHAAVLLNAQSPFPSRGKVYAFNGEVDGKPAILAHVYGTEPAPASYTIPFVVSRRSGTFGMELKAQFPPVKEGAGYITGISLNLGATFTSHGKKQSLFTASCPAPKGFSQAVFPFARASVGFAGGKTLGTSLVRTCNARG